MIPNAIEANEYAIETTSLTKSFRGVKAVNQLELKVPYGSVYGFLGPNGAGKTTTIKMLMGLTKPDQGMIRICGEKLVFGRDFQRKHVGFLPDVPHFYNWMSAGEFLSLCAGLLSMNADIAHKQIQKLLALVGLQGVQKKIGSYSRGMKQRLGIAQALVHDPKVVFLDEPSSALDPLGRKEIMDIIASLSGKTTVFFSTHILSDIERVCDRVVVLNKGSVVMEGSISQIKKMATSNTILLEIVETSSIPTVVSSLSQLQWVQKVEQIDGFIQLCVNDVFQAQHELPGFLYHNGWGLRKLIMVEPTLEDIFLQVVRDS
ncbi:MAG: ABC transporter ATP-binding protein [Caldisericia bacterium]|nr:ABC transporter ATP-binding protein [Caldisericia bacterium]MDD4614305.1 ABC transporter ATP-binding protein [Caldisericia bacterium]